MSLAFPDSKVVYADINSLRAQKRLELILENPNANFYELFSSTNSATTSATESIESGE